ncbi:MAG TPA: FAD-dependent oxidoreductase [Candidatus Limnocylindria bacterium]|nr:FAD-dependent oxidoreductase [Candidatus Limnocylindria bacterium]
MTSLWLDGTPVTPRAPLDADRAVDAAIVGGGIAGVATAYALARDGATVAVLERGELAEGASGRNAGFVLGGVAENYVAACRAFGAERATRVFRFTFANRVLLRSAIRTSAIECDVAWNGSDQVAGDDDEWREIAESARQLAAHGVRVRLDAAERTAVYDEDGELHPVRFVRGLADAAERLGARIHPRTAVVSCTAAAVRTERATVRAGAVVLCTNAYTRHLAPTRVRPVRGQICATAPLERRVFPRPAYAHRGYRYWRQLPAGNVLVGGWRDTAVDAEIGEDDGTSERIQTQLEAFLRRRGVDAPVTHRWGGTMGFSHDGLPYIGKATDGIYRCGGFTGHGQGYAMAAGELIAALVRTGSHPDADLFDPDRP